MCAVLGEKGCFGGFGERFLFVGAASGLEAIKFGGFAFAAAGEAVLLELEIAQLLFMYAADTQLDRGLGLTRFIGGMLGDELHTAHGEKGHFEAGNLVESPTNVGDGSDERAFFGTEWLELRFVRLDVRFIKDDLFGIGKEEEFAGKAVFQRVETGCCLTRRGGWYGGFLGVLAIGGETGF